MEFSLNHAVEGDEFGNMMEDLENLKSPLFDIFDEVSHLGPMICKVIKAADWRPVLIAALITILKDNSITEILQVEENASNRNGWLLNFWLKSANLITMDLISSLK